MSKKIAISIAYALAGFLMILPLASAAAKKATPKKAAPAAKKTVAANKAPAPAKKAAAPTKTVSAPAKKAAATAAKRRVRFNPWTMPTYADSAEGDVVAGEDPVVRQAALSGLGPLNGSVVVADPSNGRILTIVNQKLAYQTGYQPCSAFKVVVGLAGLTEGLVDKDTPVRVYGRTTFTLTQAIAKSNNQYFESLGSKLGFAKVSYYAKMFGLGEKATLNSEERPGTLPAQPPKNGGVGMMSSFGEGISLTPLQYAAAIGAIANGGTLFYLQHPQSQEEAERFVPRVKRELAVAPFIPEIKPGMMGTVEYGTGRRALFDLASPIFGKTGTCTDSTSPTHLGWFGSFNDVDHNKLVVVVLLTGGRPVNGPAAAEVAGAVYKALGDRQYFAKRRLISPVALITGFGGRP